MAAKIKIEIDDQTKAGASSIAQQLNSMASEASEAAESIDDIGDEMKDLIADADALDGLDFGEMAGDLDALLGPIDDVGDELSQAADKAKRLKNEIDDVGDKSKGLSISTAWTELSSKVNLIAGAFRVAGQAAQGAFQAVMFLSEKGSPAFQKLTGTATSFEATMMRIANNDSVQRWANSLADTIETGLIPSFEMLANTTIRSADTVQLHLQDLSLAAMGYSRAQRVEILANQQAFREHAAEVDRANAKAEKDRKNRKQLEEMMGVGSKVRNEAQFAEQVAGYRDPAKLAGDIKKAEESLRQSIIDAQKAGRDPKQDAEVVEWQNKITTLERKRLELTKELAREKAEAIEKEREKEKAWNSELEQIRRDHWAREKAARDQAQAETEAARRADIESFKNALEMKASMLGGGKGLGDQMRQQAGGDPRRLLNQIKQSREDDAASKWREQMKATGKMDQDGRLIDSSGWSGGNADLAMRRAQAQEERIRRQARMGAHQDAARGKLGQQEIQQATTALTNNAVEKLTGEGAMNEAAVGAIREIAKTAGRTAEEQARHTDQLNSIRQQMLALLGPQARGHLRGQLSSGGR